MQGTLQQQSIEVEDALMVQELFYQNEWTDGLPVVPPTKDKIETMLETVPMDPQTIIGTINEVIWSRKPTASLPITDDEIQKLAKKCNFVLAGIGD